MGGGMRWSVKSRTSISLFDSMLFIQKVLSDLNFPKYAIINAILFMAKGI